MSQIKGERCPAFAADLEIWAECLSRSLIKSRHASFGLIDGRAMPFSDWLQGPPWKDFGYHLASICNILRHPPDFEIGALQDILQINVSLGQLKLGVE